MNKISSRSLRYLLIGLAAIVPGFFWLGCSAKSPENAPVFAATVDRDCAPWDGPAFTVSIPYGPDSVIGISIWESPDIPSPIAFSFPDRSQRVGNALLLGQAGQPVQLTGKVYFRSVEQGVPLEGEFSLGTETGQHFNGRFIAVWGKEIVYCG